MTATLALILAIAATGIRATALALTAGADGLGWAARWVR